MLLVSHWRYLDDDTVVSTQFSEHSFDSLHPLEDGHVRAELLPSGCIWKATPNGTLMKYLARVRNNVTIGLFVRHCIFLSVLLCRCGIH
jgi:hypothetical protein